MYLRDKYKIIYNFIDQSTENMNASPTKSIFVTNILF